MIFDYKNMMGHLDVPFPAPFSGSLTGSIAIQGGSLSDSEVTIVFDYVLWRQAARVFALHRLHLPDRHVSIIAGKSSLTHEKLTQIGFIAPTGTPQA
jgi:hypothetical protein